MINNRGLEEDLTRDTLNRLILRIDEEFFMPDETEGILKRTLEAGLPSR